MIVLLSPSKTLEPAPTNVQDMDLPLFYKDAIKLNKLLMQLSADDIRSLMHVSEALAEKTLEKIHSFDDHFGPKSVRPAVMCFKGEVYQGLKASDWLSTDLSWAQENLRILSGLYGMLRPLDKMQDYRMEMGTPLTTPNGTGLYAYWKDRIAVQLKKELESHDSRYIINLASQEYFRVVEPYLGGIKVISPEFKMSKAGKLSFSSFHAKQARGLLAAFIVRNRIERPADISAFNEGGFQFASEWSDTEKWVFIKYT